MPGGIQHNPARGRYPAQATGASDCAPVNYHDRVGRHSSVRSETGHEVPDYLPDQSDTLVIPITLGGIRGAITARFIDFRPFHRSIYGD